MKKLTAVHTRATLLQSPTNDIENTTFGSVTGIANGNKYKTNHFLNKIFSFQNPQINSFNNQLSIIGIDSDEINFIQSSKFLNNCTKFNDIDIHFYEKNRFTQSFFNPNGTILLGLTLDKIFLFKNESFDSNLQEWYEINRIPRHRGETPCLDSTGSYMFSFFKTVKKISKIRLRFNNMGKWQVRTVNWKYSDITHSRFVNNDQSIFVSLKNGYFGIFSNFLNNKSIDFFDINRYCSSTEGFSIINFNTDNSKALIGNQNLLLILCLKSNKIQSKIDCFQNIKQACFDGSNDHRLIILSPSSLFKYCTLTKSSQSIFNKLYHTPAVNIPNILSYSKISKKIDLNLQKDQCLGFSFKKLLLDFNIKTSITYPQLQLFHQRVLALNHIFLAKDLYPSQFFRLLALNFTLGSTQDISNLHLNFKKNVKCILILERTIGSPHAIYVKNITKNNSNLYTDDPLEWKKGFNVNNITPKLDKYFPEFSLVTPCYFTKKQNSSFKNQDLISFLSKYPNLNIF
ncbi:hypothetical protein DID75_03975 [Candidatus Marinamargulisbacteria bacterium SCGC AG-410-N11]|nr:hypothetical protein DID75_03975 [Candidatus Marinamargulisbacteria bacterium SCGC AG-410-N11]